MNIIKWKNVIYMSKIFLRGAKEILIKDGTISITRDVIEVVCKDDDMPPAPIYRWPGRLLVHIAWWAEWFYGYDYDSFTECNRCGEERWCIYCNDPYINELCPDEDNPETYWCKACFEQRAGDI